MPTNLLVRPYRDTDWGRLCVIHDAARLDELRQSAGVAAFLPLTQAAENEGLFDYTVCVAEADGRVDGFVAFSDDELAWLYVDPACYRRGIGRALVRHAVNSAPGPLTVEVLEGNEAALRLYLDEGFRQLRRVEGRMAGNDAFPAVARVLRHMPSVSRA
ncbi:GNAT family N-acetyltransferase [Tahibacter sp.]|uniref:GNAT family N-acetyltransferase n=1 Tax=Tahibacter sp. TaxID=2056211 RepID=UPI0028C4BAF9|nr:GNAT family N-acetyltransferase [Tahibacter sp.]